MPILITILSFTNSSKELYYDTKSHPHPNIRNLIICNQIMTQLVEYFKLKNYNFEISESQISEYLFEKINELYGSNGELKLVNKIQHMKNINSRNDIDLEKYYEYILYQLTTSRWSSVLKRDLITSGELKGYKKQ